MSSLQLCKNFILKGINAGRYPVHSLLPSAHEIASIARCSAGTVQSALVELSRDGIVARVRKKGTTVLRKQQLTRVCLLLSLDPHANVILHGAVNDALARAGYGVDVVLNSEPAITEEQCVRLSKGPMPVEILVALGPDTGIDRYRRIAPLFRHRITYSFDEHAREPGTHRVMPDQQQGAKVVLEHLLGLGHRRILITAGGYPNEESWSAESGRYCQHLLEIAKAEFIPYYVFTEHTKELLARVREGVTAFWTLNDHAAVIANNTFMRAKIRVPSDVSLVGRFDTPWSTAMTPQLTSVSMNPAAVAAAITALVEKVLTGDANPEGSRTLVPMKLVVRESTAPRPKKRSSK